MENSIKSTKYLKWKETELNEAELIFNFKEHDIKEITRDGEPWFIATDVCAVLEIKRTSHAIKRLRHKDKRHPWWGARNVDYFGIRAL